MARRIQTSLLPRELPKVAGLDLAARYVPMTAVAGDLYNIIELGPHAPAFSSRMSRVTACPPRSSHRWSSSRSRRNPMTRNDPARVISGINRILCRHAGGTFVTAVYAVFDIETRTIRAANAGHPPLLLGRADRRVIQSDSMV